MLFDRYDSAEFFDEMFTADGSTRPHYDAFRQRIDQMPVKEVLERQVAAEQALLGMGITFSVYKDGRGVDRIFPFDLIPRIIPADEWQRIESGLKQRIRALNLFLADIYNERKIFKDRGVPDALLELIEGGNTYLKPCEGLKPPRGVWCHVTGTDLIRHSDGNFYVLEDNLRVPSGVSYVLENREIMKRTFPAVFERMRVRPVYDYPTHLLAMLQKIAPVHNPTIGVLTPGIFNSAYFEHSFLARQMGVQLLEGSDLQVVDGYVQMLTTKGWQRVDVLYRRIDDVFMDPQTFRPDSVLGVPGLMDVYRQGRIALANAPGTGVADDKAVYAFVPEIIKYYLGEDAILPNVPTYVCAKDDDRKFVLDNMKDLVVKPVNEAGGYGLLIGPRASRSELREFRKRVEENPRNYIAQPVMALSRVPTLIKKKAEGRHVDLRPFIVHDGEDIYVMPGGLTRVALKKGSLVVNSSQGGGSKDTWVVPDAPGGRH